MLNSRLLSCVPFCYDDELMFFQKAVDENLSNFPFPFSIYFSDQARPPPSSSFPSVIITKSGYYFRFPIFPFNVVLIRLLGVFKIEALLIFGLLSFIGNFGAPRLARGNLLPPNGSRFGGGGGSKVKNRVTGDDSEFETNKNCVTARFRCFKFQLTVVAKER